MGQKAKSCLRLLTAEAWIRTKQGVRGKTRQHGQILQETEPQVEKKTEYTGTKQTRTGKEKHNPIGVVTIQKVTGQSVVFLCRQNPDFRPKDGRKRETYWDSETCGPLSEAPLRISVGRAS